MTVFVIGGSKSGKSDFAQQIALKLAKGGKHYYVATLMPQNCASDHAIIQSHLARRDGMGFETIECGHHILSSLEGRSLDATFLLDSVTTLLSNELFPRENGYRTDEAAARRCGDDLIAFLGRAANAVIVSDDLFRDAARYDEDAFRRHLASIHCRLAQACDTVLEMDIGNPILHKGVLPE